MNDPRRVFVRTVSAWALLVFGFAGFAAAEHVERVKDIRVGTGSGNPVELTEMNGILYFGSDPFSLSSMLWRSDGTEAGTSTVFVPPASAALREPISEMTKVGNVLF